MEINNNLLLLHDDCCDLSMSFGGFAAFSLDILIRRTLRGEF